MIRYLLGSWVLDCADELVQLISHGLGVDTAGRRFEILFVDNKRVSDRSVTMERIPVAVTYDGRRTPDTGRPSSWHF